VSSGEENAIGAPIKRQASTSGGSSNKHKRTKPKATNTWFWILVGVAITGFVISAWITVSNEYVPINKKIIYANNSDIQAIITIDDNIGIPISAYFGHIKSSVSAAFYFPKVPVYIKDVKLSSDSKSIITVKNGTMHLENNTHLTTAYLSKAKALKYNGDVEIGHPLQPNNFTEKYKIDIYYRTNKTDGGPLLTMSIPFGWSISTLNFGDPSYFWIIFAGVVLSRVFVFSQTSQSGSSSTVTTHLKKVELIWVPFSAIITLLIFSSFKQQVELGPNIMTNIALAFGFGFGFDKIFETWAAKSPSRGEEVTEGTA
jgi:hypothetical protein